MSEQMPLGDGRWLLLNAACDGSLAEAHVNIEYAYVTAGAPGGNLKLIRLALWYRTSAWRPPSQTRTVSLVAPKS